MTSKKAEALLEELEALRFGAYSGRPDWQVLFILDGLTQLIASSRRVLKIRVKK
jgi:hypothetical protein